MAAGDGLGMIAVFGDPVSPELARTLDLAGYRWKAVASADEASRARTRRRVGGAIVECSADPSRPGRSPVGAQARHGQRSAAGARQRWPARRPRAARRAVRRLLPHPFHPSEFEARVRHLLWQVSGGSRPDLVEYAELVLNLETYQASIAGRPLDLTYMEYELLKFLAQNPGKVFTREMLLSRVWGYEYYGGARTVDVHVRRLRAKLGEEHAGLIQTVRSVGYRFGQSRWSS
jgi:hypothetical protein